MEKEDKKLLLKDLCARLPYGVKYCRDSWNYEWDQEMSVVEVLEDIDKEGYINYHKVYKVDDIKPYLRPMSSMTEKEKEELDELGLAYWDNGKYTDEDGNTIIYGGKEIQLLPDIETYDWLNEHHFDYGDLIGKGLALEAPKDMYK